MTMKAALAQALDGAQNSFASHGRSLAKCQALYSKDPEGFFAAFVPLLNRVLVVFKKEPAIERLVSFISKFAVHPCADANDLELRDAFTNSIISYLLTRSNADSKAVRYRVCQLIAVLLINLPEDAEISEEIYEEIVEHMLVRTRDKIPQVRAQAAAALGRLQDADDDDDPVTIEFLRLMATDSNKDSRRTVLKNVGLTKLTLMHILARTRDVNEHVRKAAYDVVKEKFGIRALTISQRVSLLKDGLTDRVQSVREACAGVCESWLKETDGDVLKLLHALDVEEYGPQCDTILEHFFTHQGTSLSPTQPPYVDQDIITPQQAHYWRALCQHLHQPNKRRGAGAEAFLPDTIDLCDTIARVAKQGRPFELIELLRLCRYADLQDEMGRRKLQAQALELLGELDMPDQVMPHLLTLLRVIQRDDEAGYIRNVLQCVSDLRDDPANEQQDGNNELGEHVWVRMLTIVGDLLVHTRKDLSHPGVQELLETTVLPAIRLRSAAARDIAVYCLGLYALLDRDVAKAHAPLLLQVMRNDSPAVRTTAMRALFDMCVVFDDLMPADAAGPAAGKSKGGKKTKKKNNPKDVATMAYFTELVAECLDDDDDDDEEEEEEENEEKEASLEPKTERRATAAEGMAKLLMFGRVNNPTLVRDLVELYFTSTGKIEQCLHVFFSVFAKLGGGAKHQSVLRAAIPSLLELTGASSGSEASATVARVGQFFAFLLGNKDVDAQQQQQQQEHNAMDEEEEKEDASVCRTPHEQLCNLILEHLLEEECSSGESKALCQAMSYLVFDTPAASKHLQSMLSQVMDQLSDKTSVKYLTKVQSTLASV